LQVVSLLDRVDGGQLLQTDEPFQLVERWVSQNVWSKKA